jgi:hypothetical protein
MVNRTLWGQLTVVVNAFQQLVSIGKVVEFPQLPLEPQAIEDSRYTLSQIVFEIVCHMAVLATM